jgi:hypothetical protein
MLRRGTESKLNEWQVETALGTWKAMQQSELDKVALMLGLGTRSHAVVLTPEMWLAW